jgi:hypothetical protein
MEQNGTHGNGTTALSDRQLAALPYLLAAPSVAEGARLADVGRTTLWRWMEDDDFRTHLERLRSEAADLAHTELQGLMLKGIMVLAEALEDASPNIKLRAAQATLAIGLRAIDLKRIQRRLDLLDDALVLRASGGHEQ